MFSEVSISKFREQSGPVFTDVVHRHQPRVIRRGKDDIGLLVGLEEAWTILADRGFSPQVLRGDDAVGIWLPELEVSGEGDNYAEAKAELLDEVRIYVQEYLTHAAEYLRAPNRKEHYPHVLKAWLADVRGDLEDVIFPGPPDLATLRARVAATA